ncbi:hypothetical protein RSSM_04691 [Rhodopirellula sallentina SM41]|uniref:Uncharacterized protein n=1 Tax=Rhodopirellula sallentina SM41 TaxID=1263870 RepID=M5TXB9_9BACT|nr:hypothetical protein RSSM_04691 [Rhodopirellula sallentina SM41]
MTLSADGENIASRGVGALGRWGVGLRFGTAIRHCVEADSWEATDCPNHVLVPLG